MKEMLNQFYYLFKACKSINFDMPRQIDQEFLWKELAQYMEMKLNIINKIKEKRMTKMVDLKSLPIMAVKSAEQISEITENEHEDEQSNQQTNSEEESQYTESDGSELNSQNMQSILEEFQKDLEGEIFLPNNIEEFIQEFGEQKLEPSGRQSAKDVRGKNCLYDNIFFLIINNIFYKLLKINVFPKQLS
jgi:hypothetical protein